MDGCKLKPIKYRDGYKYVLLETITLEIDSLKGMQECVQTDYCTLNNGILQIYARYAWDGASGPTVDTKDSILPSMVHDVLYQCVREGFLPSEYKVLADNVFYSLCIKCGMSKYRAWLWFKAVSLFGKGATIKNKDILVAP